jgi:hypothetical protein
MLFFSHIFFKLRYKWLSLNLNFILVSEIENASDNIIDLGLVKRNYNDKVYNNQVFCIQKLFKSIGRVWSTAYVS